MTGNPLIDTLFRSTAVPPTSPGTAAHPAAPAAPSAAPAGAPARVPAPSRSTAPTTAPTTAPSTAPSTAPATASAAAVSAAPVRITGTRTRAGNAMNRTRSALLTGAARAVAVSGTRMTMAQVAASSGVAKATLYNHFRTREAVLAALVVDQVDTVVAAQRGVPLEQALAGAAVAISTNVVCRGLARVEPAVLAELGRMDETAEGWRHARAAVEQALVAESRGGADLVLRWLASFLFTPASPTRIAADVAALLQGLPPAATDDVRRVS